MSTTEQIIQLKKGNRNLRASEIARTLGISREYVRQILKSTGLPTKLRPKMSRCPQCKKLFPKEDIGHGHYRKCCSPKCRYLYIRTPLYCSECDKLFYIRDADLYARFYTRNRRDKGIYCSKRCYGRHFAELYGLKPGHHFNLGTKTPKTLNILHLTRLNFSPPEIAYFTGYSYSSIYTIIWHYYHLKYPPSSSHPP